MRGSQGRRATTSGTRARSQRLREERDGDFDQFVDAEKTAIALAANLEDAREGMAAFREKRSAKYTGS